MKEFIRQLEQLGFHKINPAEGKYGFLRKYLREGVHVPFLGARRDALVTLSIKHAFKVTREGKAINEESGIRLHVFEKPSEKALAKNGVLLQTELAHLMEAVYGCVERTGKFMNATHEQFEEQRTNFFFVFEHGGPPIIQSPKRG